MSGHNLICVVTALLETGLLPMVEPVTKCTLQAPGGNVQCTAQCRGCKCESVSFVNAPAFVALRGAVVSVPNVGDVDVDVAFGGIWYAVVDARQLGLALEPRNAAEICRSTFAASAGADGVAGSAR